MIKLVVADMDGTLLNSKNEFSARLFSVIEQLHQRKVRFCVASGRQYYTLLKQFDEIQDEMTFISENGAMIFDQGDHLFTDEIPRRELEKLVQLIRTNTEVYPILCGEKTAYVESDDAIFLQNVQKYYKRFEVVEDIVAASKGDIICKIAIFDPVNAEEKLYPMLKPLENQYIVALSGENWVDLMNLGVNKGKAIQMIQKRYGISPDECMAFGDYLNDLEMMQVCTHSYAMENAHSELKKVSAYLAKSNDEDGVVDVLVEKFQL